MCWGFGTVKCFFDDICPCRTNRGTCYICGALDLLLLTPSWKKGWRSQYRCGSLTNKQLKGPECSALARNPVCSCSLRVKSRRDTAMSITVTLLFCFTLWRMGCKGKAPVLWHTERSGTKRSGKEDSGWTLRAEYRFETWQVRWRGPKSSCLKNYRWA